MAVFLRLIRAFLDIGRVQQALQAYELILDYDETLSPARLGRDLRQMTATLERVLELGAASSSESAASYRAQYLVLSRLYEETGQHDRAEATRRQVDGDLGGDTDAYVELGLTLHQMDELEESTRAFRKALAYDGGNLTARVNIGWNLYRQGKVEESIAEYESVLGRASIGVARFNLGLAYLASGRLEKADSSYARGVAEFGREQATRVGAVDDLRELIERGIQADKAREMVRYLEAGP